MFLNKNILVVVAHPDDEILGVGGTINKLVNDYNCRVKVIILGEGITSRGEKDTNFENQLSIHKNNIIEAKNILGYQELETFDFPDNKFDTLPLLDVIKTIEKVKKDFNPDVIFTHHGGDLNIDHRITYNAVITSSRPINGEQVKLVATFETLSGTEWIGSDSPYQFVPNFFLEIGNSNLVAKIKAMECYQFEKREFPHPRSPESIKSKAMSRGSTSGVPFAESFKIVRLNF
jgi:LmbE family N-acetylglucosaminyl deacetylase